MKLKWLIVSVVIVSGCTSIDVKPVASGSRPQAVCIVNNPKVMVSDFIPVLQAGFERHGITTSLVEESQAGDCAVTLTYTALRSWDFKPYLSHAELRLRRGASLIGSADYHLKGKGGFSVAKWAGTRAKMDPVIDQLLGGLNER